MKELSIQYLYVIMDKFIYIPILSKAENIIIVCKFYLNVEITFNKINLVHNNLFPSNACIGAMSYYQS